ncbi:hypothetical protein TNIN_391671 [Trichonephila inaurata madagascariensis]|uniref:Uncharacterized protein n=1 Tax=Trichonephila inaurata madagascariensis TaxID=2747483 RepID=A0A8X7BXH8_9ARAC|nr:hypothetical protein TNIN_391671 [Trichonephila inaurata madagascariensis]
MLSGLACLAYANMASMFLRMHTFEHWRCISGLQKNRYRWIFCIDPKKPKSWKESSDFFPLSPILPVLLKNKSSVIPVRKCVFETTRKKKG